MVRLCFLYVPHSYCHIYSKKKGNGLSIAYFKTLLLRNEGVLNPPPPQERNSVRNFLYLIRSSRKCYISFHISSLLLWEHEVTKKIWLAVILRVRRLVTQLRWYLKWNLRLRRYCYLETILIEYKFEALNNYVLSDQSVGWLDITTVSKSSADFLYYLTIPQIANNIGSIYRMISQ
jgi:hypothetical protein